MSIWSNQHGGGEKRLLLSSNAMTIEFKTHASARSSLFLPVMFNFIHWTAFWLLQIPFNLDSVFTSTKGWDCLLTLCTPSLPWSPNNFAFADSVKSCHSKSATPVEPIEIQPSLICSFIPSSHSLNSHICASLIASIWRAPLEGCSSLSIWFWVWLLTGPNFHSCPKVGFDAVFWHYCSEIRQLLICYYSPERESCHMFSFRQWWGNRLWLQCTVGGSRPLHTVLVELQCPEYEACFSAGMNKWPFRDSVFSLMLSLYQILRHNAVNDKETSLCQQ